VTPPASMIDHAWLIPLLPLAAAVLTLVLGAKVLKARAHWPCILALAGSAVGAVLLLVEVMALPPNAEGVVERIVKVGNYDWIWSGGLRISVELLVDPLSAVMLLAVTVVSFLVAIYSVGYMRGEDGYFRFFAEIALFVFSMTMLVLANNFLVLYVFWEAVGLCSYLLIGFWYRRPSAAAAAKKAFLVNRVGDFGFAIGIMLIFATLGVGLSYGQVFDQAAGASTAVVTAITLLLFVGACGKSAQLPLHVWLPDAMEGPTPVSALIHAATMVTAGVYMVARTTPLFHLAPLSRDVVAYVGCATAAVAAIIAITQTDLKRILAYSTVSQLGYMFVGLGVGSAAGIIAAIFHLFTHAFFKGLLFLGAGSVMHAMAGVIDIDRFSGLRRRMPVTCWTFAIGAAALAGFPLLAGFWSKDAILHAAESEHRTLLLVVGSATALVTAFYTFRAFFRTFFGPERIPEQAGQHAHESPRVMTVPLILLAVGAAGAGLALGPTHLIDGFLAKTRGLTEKSAHGGGEVLMMVSGVLAVAGIVAAYFLYAAPSRAPEKMREALPTLYRLSHRKFWFDELYDLLIVRPLFALARALRKIDDLVVDGLVHGIADLPGRLGRWLRPVQNGVVQGYALAMALGMMVILLAILLAR